MHKGKLIRFDYGWDKKCGYAVRVEGETERYILYENNRGDIVSAKPIANLVFEAYSDDVPTISREEIEHLL